MVKTTSIGVPASKGLRIFEKYSTHPKLTAIFPVSTNEGSATRQWPPRSSPTDCRRPCRYRRCCNWRRPRARPTERIACRPAAAAIPCKWCAGSRRWLCVAPPGTAARPTSRDWWRRVREPGDCARAPRACASRPCGVRRLRDRHLKRMIIVNTLDPLDFEKRQAGSNVAGSAGNVSRGGIYT